LFLSLGGNNKLKGGELLIQWSKETKGKDKRTTQKNVKKIYFNNKYKLMK